MLRLLLAAIAALTLSIAAHAADLVINDPRWEQLSDAEKADVVRQLREAGMIGPQDHVSYKGKSTQALGELNIPGLTGGAAVAKGIKGGKSLVTAVVRGGCRTVNSSELAACRKYKDAAEKKACRDDANGRLERAKATCG